MNYNFNWIVVAPTLVTNLARLSCGKMIGVQFNKDNDWIVETIGRFEKYYLLKFSFNFQKAFISTHQLIYNFFSQNIQITKFQVFCPLCFS